MRMRPDFERKPLLVFCEMGRAPMAGVLAEAAGEALVEQIAAFDKPSPILVLTGEGMQALPELFSLIRHARKQGVPVTLSLDTPMQLDEAFLDRAVDAGVKTVSLGIDDARVPEPRPQPALERTLALASYWVARGKNLQVNTNVSVHNVAGLPALFETVHDLGARAWVLHFPVGDSPLAPEAATCEALCHFLFHAAHYGVTVLTVEAPFLRRVAWQYTTGAIRQPDDLGERLIRDLLARMGPRSRRARNRSIPLRDGKGIAYVSSCGDVTASRALPIRAGNLRQRSLMDIYQKSALFTALRTPGAFGGECGRCEWRDECGGSRARAYFATGDFLAADPACINALDGSNIK